MYGVSKLLPPTPQNFFVVTPNLFPFSLSLRRDQPVNSALRFLRFGVFTCFIISPLRPLRNRENKRRNWCIVPRASRGESPYEVLGVSPSATSDQIKRAYRRLALKYHPDVNKEANAQEKFLRIKHAYTTLINSDSRRRYSSENRASDFSYGQRSQSSNKQSDDDFYGFGEFLRDVQITVGDFFRDLQEEFKNWEATGSSQGKPKSLWEELGEIGEEFVEFLEKELNINEEEGGEESQTRNPFETTGEVSGNKSKSSIEDNIDEIEATLSQLKKKLGL